MEDMCSGRLFVSGHRSYSPYSASERKTSSSFFLHLLVPNQGLRKKSVRRKLSPIECEFEGRNVLLVDDSLVRGFVYFQSFMVKRLSLTQPCASTTSREIVRHLFSCGVLVRMRREHNN